MTQEGHSDHTAVVLIHGSMMGSWVWDKVLPHLSHRSLAVDLPGRGLHPQEPGVVRLPDAARSVIDDIDAAGLRDVVLVGHSLGGVVAVAAAASLGSARARGLVFLSSVVPREGRSWVRVADAESHSSQPHPATAAQGSAGTGKTVPDRHRKRP